MTTMCLAVASLLSAVMLPPQSTAVENHAAEEFRRYAGDFPAVLERGADDLGADGFRLYEKDGTLHIAGGKRGILYGVYEALERFWGVRWYASDFTVDPKKSDVRIPKGFDLTERPAFRTRIPYYYDVRENREFAARLRVNSSLVKGLADDPRLGGTSGRLCRGLEMHSSASMVPAAKYAKTHPEYFSMRNGKRLVVGDPQYDMQLCLTNPDVFEIFVTNVCAALEKDPTAEEYSVGQNDNVNYCECPACAAVNAEEESTAGTLLRFANRVAAAVETRFPGRKAVTCGYQWTRKPPKKTRPAPNVLISFSSIECDQSHPLASGRYPENIAVRKDLEGWRAQGARFSNWTYVTQFSAFQMPFANLGAVREDLVYYRDHGVEEMLSEGCYCCSGCDLEALRAWLIAKWLWNPDLDEETLVNDFCTGYYRSAAPYVKAYYKLLRALPEKDTGFCLDCCHVSYYQKDLVTDEFLAEADRLWTAAEKAAETESLSVLTNVLRGAFPVRFTIFQRLNDRYSPVPYSLRRGDPSADPDALRHRALAQELLKVYELGRPIYRAESRDAAVKARAMRETVARSAVAVPAKGTESFTVESGRLDVCGVGRDVDWVKDAEATQGKALKFRNTKWNWNARLDLPGNVFDKDKSYRLRVRIKVEKTPGGSGNVLAAGFFNPNTRKEHSARSLSAADVADGRWQWVDLGLFTPQESQYLWIMAGQFDRKTYDRNPAVEAVYLDRVEISRADSVRTFALVRNGRAAAEIVRTGNWRVDRDIDFFTNAVFRATGALLPVVDKPAGGLNAVNFTLHKASVIKEDNWAVTFPSTNLMEIHGTEMSCRWEMNRILEVYCGYVACCPGPHGTHYGNARDISLERVRHTGSASFCLERYQWREDAGWERACGGKRLELDSEQSAFGAGFHHHALWKILPVEKYGKDPWREKVMPMIDGKRQVPKHSNMCWQPCFSSSVVDDEIVKNVSAWIEKHPDTRVVSLGQSDGEGYCRCPDCVKLNGGTGRKSVFLPRFENWSNAYFAFVNRIARRLHEKFPHLVFGCNSYVGTTDPPDFRLEPYILAHVTEDIYQSRDPERDAKKDALLRAWNEKSSMLGVYDYAYGMIRYAPPRLYTALAAKSFQRKRRYPALNQFFAESSSFDGEGPKRWISYRFLFDVNRDYETEMNRWCRACCGAEAAPHLREYYRAWEDFWMGEAVTKTPWYRTVNDEYCDFWNPNWVFALDDGTMARARAALEKMLAAAVRSGDAEQRVRAERLRLYHEYYEARIYCSGRETATTGGRVTTPEQTVAFVDSLAGAMGKAYRTLRERTDAICALRYAEPPEETGSDTPARAASRWQGMVESFRVASYDNYFLSLRGMGGVCTFRDDPSVRSAIGRAASAPTTAEPFRSLFAKMYEDVPRPDVVVASGDTREQDLAKWAAVGHNATVVANGESGFAMQAKKTGWTGLVRPYQGLKPDHWYVARAVLRHDGKSAPITASVILRVHGGNWQAGPTCTVSLKDGGSATAASYAFLYRTRERNGRQDVADFYIDASGLKTGESLFVDRVELLDLGETKMFEDKEG